MSTHNIVFYEEKKTNLSLNYHQISSNTHLISFARDVKTQTGLAQLHKSAKDIEFTVI